MISDVFVQAILEELYVPGVLGVGLVGSYARNEETQYSDIDLEVYVEVLPPRIHDRSTLTEWHGTLLSVKYLLLREERLALTRPERAIWSVPRLREMKILLDPDGLLRGLQRIAVAFDWKSLQQDADRYASDQLVKGSEEVHKIVDGLTRQHESTVVNAIWGLASSLMQAVAVQRGVMISSENQYFEQIEASVGWESDWTLAFRSAWGLVPPVDGIPPFQSRGAAALRLYQATAKLLDGILPDGGRPTVEGALILIRRSKFTIEDPDEMRSR